MTLLKGIEVVLIDKTENGVDEFNPVSYTHLMREKEITNKELATLTGLHVKTIREVRKGLTATRYSTLRKIYKVLKEIKNND